MGCGGSDEGLNISGKPLRLLQLSDCAATPEIEMTLALGLKRQDS
jgi:hypothetical protein